MKYQKILKQYWGYDDFRGIQREIIESIGEGKDTLGLMPTGGGKSITFQVPALTMSGTCLVITPLISLMKDQVEHLRQKYINAAAIYSGMSHAEVVRILDNCILGSTKFLYVSPERLSSEFFRTKLSHMQLSFITVDEAHCICQWGYDFRPSYLQIAEVRKLKPDTPILALTATATPEVANDIQRQLQFKAPNVHRMSFERKNLVYVVRDILDKEAHLLHILQSTDGCSIVYARSRKRTKEIADYLNKAGIPATFYHAGLDHSVKDKRQMDWQNDKVRVMVATNAFGMGIDKPDVRTVIHIDCPESLEAYFQEAGRAGRDGQRSYAVLLTNSRDKTILQQHIRDSFPPKEYIRKVYEHLAYFFQVGINSSKGKSFNFEIDKFCTIYHFFPTAVTGALNILSNAGYIRYESNPDLQARLRFLLKRDELYMLHETAPLEEKVITALLRTYGTLFVDYTFIQEDNIAKQCNISKEDLYLVLRSLTKKRILHYIPQSNQPYITYLEERLDETELRFPPAIYENLLKAMQHRVGWMIHYITQKDEPCSKLLLRYFGEK